MNKFFTLMVAASTIAFNANAEDVTFDIVNHYGQVIVSKHNSDSDFFVVSLDKETMDELKAEGITTETPDALLAAAADMYLQNDDYVYNCDEVEFDFVEEAPYTIVAATVEGKDDSYVTTSAPTIKTIDVTFRVIENPVNLTFDVSMSGSILSITPSDLNQKYIYVMANVADMDENFDMKQVESTLDMISHNSFGIKYTGAITDDLSLYDDEYGTYKFFGVAVNPDEEDLDKWGYYRCGEIYVCEFVYNGSIDDIKIIKEETIPCQKAMYNGRMILNGKYTIDGKLLH